MVTASFFARPGATCQLTVGGVNQDGEKAPFPPAVADATGHVSWTWRLADNVKKGTVTAWVACSGGGLGQAELTVG
jgi:predicted deacylase